MNLVVQEDDYLKLLKLSDFLSVLEKQDLADLAIKRASSLNPSSCILKRRMYALLENSPQFYAATDIKSKYWYCF